MTLILESITFGVVVAFLIFGLIGVIVPIIPGTLLMWIGVLLYVWHTGFTAVNLPVFLAITLIAFVTGTADFWLPLMGAKTGGASGRALLLGAVGAIAGTFLLPIPIVGTVAGYALGLLLGEYQRHGDWELAKKASLRGLAGWGLATAVQLGGGLLILLIFVIQVLGS